MALSLLSKPQSITPKQLLNMWGLQYYELACALKKSESHIRLYVNSGKVPESTLSLCTELHKSWSAQGYAKIEIYREFQGKKEELENLEGIKA